MATRIRLARGGAKKRPHYRIVVADSRAPRDGRYIERLGTYDPMLPKDSGARVKLNVERIKYWLGQGARPTDRVAVFLAAADLMAKRKHHNPHKAIAKKLRGEGGAAAAEAVPGATAGDAAAEA